MPMRKRVLVISAIISVVFPACLSANGRRNGASKQARNRILLVPLDDRPSSVHFPQMIGKIGDVEVIAPPKEMLGRFLEPGQPAKITQWIHTQDLKSFDAVIISIDMLAYGGLVNSRVHRTNLTQALDRLQLVNWMHRSAPQVPIFGSSVIMRLAPTGDRGNEVYRAKLSRWAELSPDSDTDAKVKEEVARLEREIPPEALADYKAARERNLKINQASVEMVRNGAIDYLILSQDDAQPRGLHVADRERLLAEVQGDGLAERVAVQPGADEVAMLLLARALNRQFQYSPRIAAVYSSEAARDRVAPFEDRPLHETVSLQIAATGSREVADPSKANIVFFVYASRAEPGVAGTFAEKIEQEVSTGRRHVIVADIDTRGDIQGAALGFVEEMRRRKIFPRLAGYAAWNTAGNTIGTALPQGLVYSRGLRDRTITLPPRRERIAAAQIKFLLHRMLDDYAFHSVVRPAAKQFAADNHLNPNELSGDGLVKVTNFIKERMRALSKELWQEFASAAAEPYTVSSLWGVTPDKLSDFALTLPWGRTFEADINFSVRIAPGKHFGQKKKTHENLSLNENVASPVIQSGQTCCTRRQYRSAAPL